MHPFNFGSFAAASLRTAHNFLPHSAGSSLHLQPQQQQQLKSPNHARLRVAAAAAAAAATGAAGIHLYRKGTLRLLQPSKPAGKAAPAFLIPKELAEVVAGAFAEIVQVAVLYPLDTIKVRCQAGGLPVSSVVKQLLANPGTAVAQLYAGVVSASLASVVVGSLYFFTFCAAKRAAMKMVAEAEHKHNAAKLTTALGAARAGAVAPALSEVNSSSSSHLLHVQQQAGGHVYPHGAGVDCHYDPVFAAICSDDAAAKVAAAATTSNTSITSSSNKKADAAEPSSQGRLQANLLAACAAALVGALVEAPLELFKHRAQVGQIQGSMLGAMFKALKHQGPGALYGSFFLPFCFKSLPFDMGELVTYSTLQDWKERAAAAQSRVAAAAVSSSADNSAEAAQPHQQQEQQRVFALGSITAANTLACSSSNSSKAFNLQEILNNTPEHVWDMAAGAAAGAAAVLVSMPPDCIKTVLETGGGVPPKPGSGALGSVAAFAATGKQLVQHRGVTGGLFMGLTPRLVESVPSTMLYWLAVEAARRVLEPYTA